MDIPATNPLPPPETPVSPWYHTRSGRVFLVILTLIMAGLFSFGGLIGYYAWKIKTGQGKTIANELRAERLTLDTSRAKKQPPKQLSFPVQEIIRPHNPTFGNPDAKMTIVAFIDFECPFSRAAHAEFNDLMKQYEPVARIVFKHLPLTAIHPNSQSAALAAACADEQEKFWQYYDQLFALQDLDRVAFLKSAQTTSLNLETFTACLDSKKYQNQIDEDLADAAKVGVRGTPTYVVNQTVVEGATERAKWDTIILDLLPKK
ncbi:MAG: thioredoxin domain-containing protein [Candidatus Magasanikbacteria bacterium]|nr:thioredoxin domain-containing protein [Candidatus Magasanikbacteria bacterium]